MVKRMKVLAAGTLALLFLAGCSTKNSNVTMDQANVTLGEYKGIEVSVEQQFVTKDEIHSYAEWMVQSYNKTAKSDRTTVEDGDAVYAEVYIYDEDGNLLDDGNGHEGFIEIGSNTTYKELEQGIVGANVGDELEIPMTFPDPYEFDESLSGKSATCKVKISYIRETNEITLDKITNEQAKLIFDVDSTDKIDGVVQKTLEEQKESAMRQAAYDVICEKLLETCAVEPFPGKELEARVEKYMKQAEEMCSSYYDMTLEEYYKMLGTTAVQYRKDVESQLTDTIKLELIFTAIADQENIQYDEAEYQAYIDKILNDYTYETADDIYEEYGEDYVKRAFRIEYVVDWLIDNADMVYTAPARDAE